MSTKYFDLGKGHREITTVSEEAQRWFDRGLTWIYGFNHDEAIICFNKAIEADSSCVMAYWELPMPLARITTRSGICLSRLNRCLLSKLRIRRSVMDGAGSWHRR